MISPKFLQTNPPRATRSPQTAYSKSAK
uniref:Uncharacterized protein n=1 Tax=Zea mays TaxID=4577 RepID=C4IZS1_MAIZE|nr:unknown [Zea mays]